MKKEIRWPHVLGTYGKVLSCTKWPEIIASKFGLPSLQCSPHTTQPTNHPPTYNTNNVYSHSNVSHSNKMWKKIWNHSDRISSFHFIYFCLFYSCQHFRWFIYSFTIYSCECVCVCVSILDTCFSAHWILIALVGGFMVTNETQFGFIGRFWFEFFTLEEIVFSCIYLSHQ